jgi:hypothetical protein
MIFKDERLTKMESQNWLPLTEYALRSGISISTLRRKIKSNGIDYRMEEGRYLIRSDEMSEDQPSGQFASHELPINARAAAPIIKTEAAEPAKIHSAPVPIVEVRQEIKKEAEVSLAQYNELKRSLEELKASQSDDGLRWRALEARLSGLAKKLEMYSEQMAELKMLVKIFEEKLDNRA